MTLHTTFAHWIIHDDVGSDLWSLRQLLCDYRALVRVSLAFSRRTEVPFRKWGNTKNPLKLLYHHHYHYHRQLYEERKCRSRATLFYLDFSRRYHISSFIDLIGGISPVPNVFPISVTGFCDMTNAAQINRAHYLPLDFKYFVRSKK